jgi:hypothetical protein
MKLWQDKTVVDTLQRVLEDYPYLEYNEAESKRPLTDARAEALKIKITDSSEKSASAGREIASELRKATGRQFEYIPSDSRFKKKHIRIAEFRRSDPEKPLTTDNS